MNTLNAKSKGRLLHIWLLVVVAIIDGNLAIAQNLPPALMVEQNNRSTPLAIVKADVDVRIVGVVAETSMTVVFHNSLSRPLAGDLYFPLPPGATASGYALDVNGVMVDGVVVDKDRGRQVFEKETRKGVDPGLVEWTRGNHFKTRVFPIPARGTRTVRVCFLSEIQRDEQGDYYALPLHFKDKLREFHLRLEVVKAEGPPATRRQAPVKLQFSKWRDSFVAEAGRTNASVIGDVVINLPGIDEQQAFVEKASDGNYYFCASEIPVDLRDGSAKQTLPALRQVTIFWDASGSRADTDHQRELNWLKTWFAAYAKNALIVNLVTFRNELSPAQRFTVTNGNATALLNAVSRIAYDGGTQLGCLTNHPAPAGGGVYFLFTDGMGNIGRTEPPPFDAPLYVFTADQSVDAPFLEYLARRSGGVLFSLRQLNDQQVLAGMAAKPFSFLNADFSPREATEVFPRKQQPVHGRFTFVGRLTSAQASIVLNYGNGREQLSGSTRKITRTATVEGNLLRKYWAQKKLEDLLALQKQNQPEIAELGKQHGLVTPFTSLIVLEQVEQYVEHRIMPPISLPKMRAEYGRLVEEADLATQREEREKTEHLLDLWNKRVAWWNQKFTYPDNFKFREEEATGRGRRPVGLTPISGGAIAPQVNSAGVPLAEPAVAAMEVQSDNFHQDRTSLGSAKDDPPQAGIAIKEWDPKTPYLQALKRAPVQDVLAVYLQQRKSYKSSPSFYLDCGEFFRRQGQNGLGIRVLSNIAELELDNAALLRVLAYRLLQIGQLDLACGLFEDILKLRPEEPQSFRDLALALTRRGQAKNSSADLRRALELLAKVVNEKWDRFDEIEVVALMELNSLWADYERRFPGDKTRFPVDARLKKLIDLDTRILLTWDVDMTDVDLHITEPSGEVAMYSHNLTRIGGLVSRDFTQGYGPEEYCLRKAMPGTYKIEANYYGSQAAQLLGPVTVQAEVITHFGRPSEKRKSLTLRLEDKKETVVIGEVEF